MFIATLKTNNIIVAYMIILFVQSFQRILPRCLNFKPKLTVNGCKTHAQTFILRTQKPIFKNPPTEKKKKRNIVFV